MLDTKCMCMCHAGDAVPAALEGAPTVQPPDQAAIALTAGDIPDAKSRYLGVTWDRKQAKWAATVQHGSEVLL